MLRFDQLQQEYHLILSMLQVWYRPTMQIPQLIFLFFFSVLILMTNSFSNRVEQI